jgi:hypothetical protein
MKWHSRFDIYPDIYDAVDFPLMQWLIIFLLSANFITIAVRCVIISS